MRKKILSLFLALAASVGMMWAQGPWTSGDCTLTLSGGVMTVSGNGAMADYGNSNPWKSYNSSITSIVIEDGVTHVGNGTFPQCTSLVSVVIGDDVETIGEFTFDDAGASLTSVTMGNKVKSIGMAAFLWDTGLSELILSEDLETIGDYAFCRMEALTTITIPSKVTSIGAAAFSNCSALQSIYIEATTPPTLGDGVFANVNADLSTIPLYVPNGSVAAYEAAAQWTDFDIQGYDPAPTPANVCGDGLTWELSEGVLTISYDGEGTGEMYDFGYEYDENPVNVAPWKENKSAITTVIVGDGVKSIGNNAFNDLYDNFTAVTIANSVERIGVFAFANAKWVTEMTLPSALQTIDQECFAANFGITSITIPSGVTSIGSRAFSYCTALTSLTCEATTPPTLGTGVFKGIKNKQDIPLYVPSESVDAYTADTQWNAFDINGYDPAPAGPTNPSGSCGTNLSWEFNPATGVLTITGSGAMPTIWDTPSSVSWHAYRADITSVSLPDGLTTIGGYAFYSCPGLTSVTIPENVTNIAISAFANCANLASVTLPNSVLSIGQSALALCPSMTSLTLGSGLSSIGTAAFSGCSGLESVTNYATTPQVLDSYAFYNVEISNCELYVPEESVAAYQAATTWKDFKNVQAIGPASTPTDEQVPTNADPENPSYHYSTFFHSTQNYKLTNDGTQAFIADLSGSDLVLTKIAEGAQVIPANTAVILRKSGSADPVVLAPTSEPGVSFSANNDLKGVDNPTLVTDITGLTLTNCYVLSGKAYDESVSGVGFYKIYGNTLKAHKAYVKYAGGQNNAPKRMRFVFENEQNATGMESIQPSAVSSQKVLRDGQLIIIKNGVRYNAQGQIVK